VSTLYGREGGGGWRLVEVPLRRLELHQQREHVADLRAREGRRQRAAAHNGETVRRPPPTFPPTLTPTVRLGMLRPAPRA
jgi:hypothetical protein